MKIGFAIIPELSFLNKIISLEHCYHEKAGFCERLGLLENLPHITLFQGNVKERLDFHELAEFIAREVTENFPDLLISFSQVVYVPEGWYFLECQPDRFIYSLHNEFLEKIKPFINLDPSRLDRNLELLSSQQVMAIREYGYRYAGEAFYPHITIGRTDRKDEKLIQELNSIMEETEKKAQIARVTVYEMGPNGTHKKTLYEINLLKE